MADGEVTAMPTINDDGFEEYADAELEPYMDAAREYLVNRHPYDYPDNEEGRAARQSHIDYDARSTARDPEFRRRVDNERASATLNTIGYEVAEALGKVSGGLDYAGDPLADARELIRRFKDSIGATA